MAITSMQEQIEKVLNVSEVLPHRIHLASGLVAHLHQRNQCKDGAEEVTYLVKRDTLPQPKIRIRLDVNHLLNQKTAQVLRSSDVEEQIISLQNEYQILRNLINLNERDSYLIEFENLRSELKALRNQKVALALAGC